VTTVKQGVFAGAAAFGFLKAANQNRKTNRALRRKARGKELTPEQERLVADNTVKVILPDGTELQRAEPIIPGRTSTKSLLGGTFLAQIYVQLVGLIPHEALVAALTTPEMIALVSVALAALVARFSKSPAVPGKL
jgi:hypothetical protein